MSKLKTLIVAAVIASSSAAIAAPTVTVTASANASFRFGSPASSTVVIRDHRTPVRVDQRDHRFDDRYDVGRAPVQRPIILNVAGRYTSNHGDIRLTQRGNQVFGTYVTAHDGISGVVTGTIENGVIRFSWDQKTSKGFGTWFVDGNGRITGSWGTNASATDGGAWNLLRM